MGEEIKEFKEVHIPKPIFPGAVQLKIEEILGKDIVIKEIKWFKSDYPDKVTGAEKEYAVVLATEGETLITFQTGSGVVCEQLREIESKLPIKAKLIQKKRYFTLQ